MPLIFLSSFQTSSSTSISITSSSSTPSTEVISLKGRVKEYTEIVRDRPEQEEVKEYTEIVRDRPNEAAVEAEVEMSRDGNLWVVVIVKSCVNK